MAENWRRGFEAWLTGENDGYVFQEYLDEIQLHLLPYIVRMVATGYINQAEAANLTSHFLKQIDLLKEMSERMGDNPPTALWSA
jgi:hypothetical protein